MENLNKYLSNKTILDLIKKIDLLAKNTNVNNLAPDVVSEAYYNALNEYPSFNKDLYELTFKGKEIRVKKQTSKQLIKNMLLAYEQFDSFDPFTIDGFLHIHSIVAHDIEFKENGFREMMCNTIRTDKTYFKNPSGSEIPGLVADVFSFIQDNKNTVSSYLLAIIGYYRFYLIHPFEGEFCKTIKIWFKSLLAKFNPVFRYLPIEKLIYEQREQLYKLIEFGQDNNDFTDFVIFMLKLLLEAILPIANN